MPRVTVLLSVHNGERHLREAVDSILRQSFGDFEFLILDDGSTDTTPDILRSYDDRRIRLIDNGTNLGLTRSLNRGIQAAGGEFLARQDADDVSAPERLDKQVSFLDAHRDVTMVGTWYTKIDDTGQPLGDRSLPGDSTDLRWSLLFYCPFVHSAVMFRLDTVRSRVGLYDETIRYAQDHDLWSRMARQHRVANLPEHLVSYRIADSSMSSTYGRTVDDDHDRIVTGNVKEVLGGMEFRKMRVDTDLCRLAGAILMGLPQEFDANGIDHAVAFLKQLHISFSAYYRLSSGENRIHRVKVFSQAKDNLVRAAHRFADGNRYLEARQCLSGAKAARFVGIFEDGTWRLALKLAAGPRAMEALRRIRGGRKDPRQPDSPSPKPPTPSAAPPGVTIALLPFGFLIEDFLDKIKVSLEVFCTEMTGGWLFGYMEALRSAGVRTVLICWSARVTEPAPFLHKPSGMTVWVLPSPPVYLAMRRRIRNPYARDLEQACGPMTGVRRITSPWYWMLKELAPYLSTPSNQLVRTIRREKCDAIVCQEYEYPGFDVCVRLGRRLALPVSGVFQGGDYQRGRLERAVRPFSMRACSGLIIATSSEAQRVRRRYSVPESKQERIFNPIDVDEMWRPVNRADARASLEIPRAARVAVWHGRVAVQQKGLDILLAAWEQVCRERQGRDLRLLLVGTGQDAEELQKRIAAMAVRNVQSINEYVLDRARLRAFLSAADVYVFLSRHEGFPVAPTEAMACGLPVVAAATNGIPDILEDGEASGGVVVPQGDAVAAAVALGRLLDDETLSRDMGRRARIRAEQSFSLAAVGEQLRRFLISHGASSNSVSGAARS